MKKTIPALFILVLTLSCKFKKPEESYQVLVDNDKVKVTEYTGDPTGAVCGSGLHQHGPHLTILLTDGTVMETKDGKVQKREVYKGLCYWSNGGTHTAVNIGKSTIKSIIVEVKEPNVTQH